MKPVTVPTTDVNSESFVVVRWHLPDNAEVQLGQLVAEVETSKAIIDVTAPDSGQLLQLRKVGDRVPMESPIGYVFPDQASLERFQQSAASETRDVADRVVRATNKAVQLARTHNIALDQMEKTGLITAEDVEQLVSQAARTEVSDLPSPLELPEAVERVLIVGGGRGANQVLGILRDDPEKAGVAVVDDDAGLWGNSIDGVPIVGGCDRLGDLHHSGTFDAAVISINSSNAVRAKMRSRLRKLQIPLTNAVDSTAKIAATAVIGTGNVICAFCHFGECTVVGDNNFFSAYNSFDHHCQIGSEICTGPGCMISGSVKVGSRVRMGAGIVCEYYLEIGDDVQIASGAVLTQSVPAAHAVKTKLRSHAVVPLRER